jgi:hypothetical protein
MPERISGLNWAWSIPPGWDAKRMIAFFLELRETNFLPRVAPQPLSGRSLVSDDFYRSEYLDPSRAAVRDDPAVG